MNGFLGKDGFAWFFGVVEDRKDPLKLGRVRVRVLGYHHEDRNVMPTSDLPWATPIQSVTSAGLGGIGMTPFGLVEGSWVLGFFTDPGSYQIPMVLGSIGGLNSNPLKMLGEEFGTGFKDLRSFEELKNAPNNQMDERKYPDGQGLDGDKHGAQLKTSENNSTYPRSTYVADATKNADGTPDTNILGVNDSDRLDKTAVGVKTAKREDGGTRETEIPVSDIVFDKFETGITGESGAAKGTNKGLGVGYNGLQSSSKPSLKQNYKQFKDQPTNANGKTVYSTGTGSVGAAGAIPAIISAAAGCYKNNLDGVRSGAAAIKQNVINQTNSTVKTKDTSSIQRELDELRRRNVGQYVQSSNGSLVSPYDIDRARRETNDFLSKQTSDAASRERERLQANAAAEDAARATQAQTTQPLFDANGNPITLTSMGNININGNDIPIIDVTEKINNQLDPNNINRDAECGDCGCKDGVNCKD
jgi:hypothetical protein